MRNIVRKITAFMKKEDGPTAVEYAVMLALIVVVCIAAITTLGTNANNTFSSVGEKAGPSSIAPGSILPNDARPPVLPGAAGVYGDDQ